MAIPTTGCLRVDGKELHQQLSLKLDGIPWPSVWSLGPPSPYSNAPDPDLTIDDVLGIASESPTAGSSIFGAWHSKPTQGTITAAGVFMDHPLTSASAQGAIPFY
jgi:hypothetical protein